MYFLNSALSGIRRRLLSSLLAIFGGAALLTAMAAIGTWSYWIGWEKQNLKASRTAAIFVDSTDKNVVEEVLTQVMQTPGVDSARIISTEEFTGFLKQHFSDLASAVQELGEDVIPRTLEVVFPASSDGIARGQALSYIGKIKNVVRVDDSADRMGKALASLTWLSYGGLSLALGLWFVLLLVCLGHYQSTFYTDAQEIHLIRSFGATKLAILTPWLLEALIESLLTGILSVIALTVGKNYLSEVYNQFFGALGYEPFLLNSASLTAVVAIVFFGALIAHVFGGLFALMRGNIA